ncbi:MAG: tetratricopeptide repeat protein [Proteobacteria bacterium]|nr:tetratricopeptide repeat protein [Pseudomonadota bacterium]
MSIQFKKFFPCLFFTALVATSSISFADMDRGLAYYNKGDFKNAETEFLNQLSINPNSAYSHYYLGLIYAVSEEYKKSTDSFQKAQKGNKKLPDIDFNIGKNYYYQNLNSEAITYFNKVAKKEPDNAENLMFLGLAYQAEAKHQQAVDTFKKARKADKELAQVAVFNSAASYQQTGNKPQQRAHLEEAVKINPNNAIADNSRRILDTMSGDNYGPIEQNKWKFTGSISFEHDDNVTVDEVNVNTNKSDNASIIEFSAENLIYADETYEAEIGYDFYQSIYNTYDDFNLQSHSFYVDGARKYTDFDLGLNYRYNYNSLGDHKFYGSHIVKPNIWYSASDTWFIDGFYSYENKKFFKNSDRDADTNNIGFTNYIFITPDDMLIAGAYYEDEDTDGDEYDYDGYSAYISYEKKFMLNAKEVIISLGYDYEDNDYNSITPSIGKKRHDKRKNYNLDFEYPITDLLSAIFYYEYIDSDSNLDSSDYKEHITGIKLEAKY